MSLSFLLLIVLSSYYVLAYTGTNSSSLQRYSLNKRTSPVATASSTGVIDISWPLYAVDVDFTDLSDDEHPRDNINLSGKMGIALYTNESFFGGSCNNFLLYNCSEHHCYPSVDDKRNISFPYFEVQGYISNAELYIDYDFFSNSHMSMVYSQNCTPDYISSTNMIYGMVGLGLSGSSIHNFFGDYPTFSVYLEDGGLTGSITFDCDDAKIKQGGYKKTVSATSNWEIALSKVSVGGLDIPFQGHVILDLNTVSLGFPATLYTQILDNLQTSYNLICDDPDYLPNCFYSGTLSDLPPIKLDSNFDVPSDLYLHKMQDNVYSLMIVPLSSNSSDFSYVTTKYQDFVILGVPFLQHYYTCFEARPSSAYQISIYDKNSDPTYNPTTIDTIYLIVSIAIPILLCCCCIIFACRKAKNKKKLAPEANEEKDSFVLLFDSSDQGSPLQPFNDNKFVKDKGKEKDKHKGQESSENAPKGTIFSALERLSARKSSDDGDEFNASFTSSDNAN